MLHLNIVSILLRDNNLSIQQNTVFNAFYGYHFTSFHYQSSSSMTFTISFQWWIDNNFHYLISIRHFSIQGNNSERWTLNYSQSIISKRILSLYSFLISIWIFIFIFIPMFYFLFRDVCPLWLAPWLRQYSFSFLRWMIPYFFRWKHQSIHNLNESISN